MSQKLNEKAARRATKQKAVAEHDSKVRGSIYLEQNTKAVIEVAGKKERRSFNNMCEVILEQWATDYKESNPEEFA